MRGLGTALALLAGIAPVHADGDPAATVRVRSSQVFVRRLLQDGAGRSPTLRNLIGSLQQSNVIVMVEAGACARGRIRSCVTSVTGSELARQIRIVVDPHTTTNRLIAAIAHELQHAVEIADRRDVVDGRTALELYRRIGKGLCAAGLSSECETTRALDVEKRVLEELSARLTSP